MTKIIQPTYLTKLPSTGETVKYRPFSVKEEKALLLALQEDNIATVSEAIKSTVSRCTDGAIDPSQVPYYDVEYLYLQIRSKSIGEVIDLIGSCECSDRKTEFSVDIDTVEINPKPEGSKIFKILDTEYSVKMRHPSIDDFVTSLLGERYASEEVVANCIQSIFTDEEIMGWSTTEKLDFVESMSPRQQTNISEFLESMPVVSIPTKYKCVSCGKEHTGTISGFESFFV
jgi:T4 bacteriophage base plate protein